MLYEDVGEVKEEDTFEGTIAKGEAGIVAQTN